MNRNEEKPKIIIIQHGVFIVINQIQSSHFVWADISNYCLDLSTILIFVEKFSDSGPCPI